MADDSESELEVVSESESNDGGGRQPARAPALAHRERHERRPTSLRSSKYSNKPCSRNQNEYVVPRVHTYSGLLSCPQYERL
jgi:hypothetical protein